MAVGVIEERLCPECGTGMAFSPHFVTWCEACDWNVDPSPPPRLNWRDRRVAQASAKASRKQFERISRSDMTHAPRRLPATYVVAALVHLLTVLSLAAGILMLVDGFGIMLPLRVIFGGMAVGSAAVVQPFWSKRRKRSKPAGRDELPELFKLADEVAAALGCKGLDGVLFSPVYSAWIQRSRRQGWVMTIGLALWVTLSPQEKVALIGHELGHQLNKDQRKSMLVYGAAYSMARWSYLWKPGARITPVRGLPALAEPLAFLVMLPVTLSAAGLAWLLMVLGARQGLAAEYYADVLAAEAAGSSATASLLEQLLLAEACHRQLEHVAKFKQDADPWTELAAYAASIPAQERERQRRLGRLRLPAVDDSHPPTQLRADLIRKLPSRTPKVTLDSSRAATIEHELARITARATANLRSRYPR